MESLYEREATAKKEVNLALLQTCSALSRNELCVYGYNYSVPSMRVSLMNRIEQNRIFYYPVMVSFGHTINYTLLYMDDFM